jgi:hypothetical protein
MKLAALGLLAAVLNHLPFPVNQPVTVGGQVYFEGTPGAAVLFAQPEMDGLHLKFQTADLGRLTWSLAVQPAAESFDAAGQFDPLKLKFQAEKETALFTDYEAKTERAGMAVHIVVRVFPAGFLDTRVSLSNVSAARADGMYAAVVARWEHPPLAGHQLCYDNRKEDFDSSGRSRFSAGEGRHWALQHGIDWLSLDFGGAAALLLSSYSESPTVLDDTPSTRTQNPRFTGLNIPQFKNEAQIAKGTLYLVTEFVRSNRLYRDRFLDMQLPQHGQVLTNESRAIFSAKALDWGQADRAFLTYNAWAQRLANGDVEVGVPATVFGTSYFPYSTLGENFGTLKLPGQQTDAFWPLSADTVTHWRDFADDIRRDLRIAKAMGFTVVRLHYVDVIASLPEPLQYEYLDFLFSEIRHLKLRVLFSTAFRHWTPEQIAERVARYQDAIDRLEIENEILIEGIPLDRPQYWIRVQQAVKQAAPHVQIHWTSHLNTGVFGRMADLRIPVEVISAHAYLDGLDAIPSGRGFALAVGAYARRQGKPAIYTEWNWRGLTRMTPEARAQVYPSVMENLLATRSIGELYQFQMQETLCVNPNTRKGIRHYEPIWLSRRPKPEAFELMKLMDRYAAPDTPNRMLGADHPVIEGPDGTATFHLENRTGRPLTLQASIEAPPPVQWQLPTRSLHIAAHGQAEIAARLSLPADARPGFYHVFLRLEGPDGLVRYGWAELRRAGQPEGASIDLNRPLNVVYRQDAPVSELEAAYLLAQTAESASGRTVGLYSEQDLPHDGRAVLRVDNYDDTVKLVLSYWTHAKDSAARKIGLIEKKVPLAASALDNQ